MNMNTAISELSTGVERANGTISTRYNSVAHWWADLVDTLRVHSHITLVDIPILRGVAGHGFIPINSGDMGIKFYWEHHLESGKWDFTTCVESA